MFFDPTSTKLIFTYISLDKHKFDDHNSTGKNLVLGIVFSLF